MARVGKMSGNPIVRAVQGSSTESLVLGAGEGMLMLLQRHVDDFARCLWIGLQSRLELMVICCVIDTCSMQSASCTQIRALSP